MPAEVNTKTLTNTYPVFREEEWVQLTDRSHLCAQCHDEVPAFSKGLLDEPAPLRLIWHRGVAFAEHCRRRSDGQRSLLNWWAVLGDSLLFCRIDVLRWVPFPRALELVP